MTAADARGDRPTGAGRDRRTVRRGLRAGAVAWAVVSLPLLAAVVVGGGDGRGGLAAVLLGVTLGGLVASGWLLLAALLDLWAGEPPGARRVAVTGAVVLATFLSPVLLRGAGG